MAKKRLTQALRDVIVRRITFDIPTVDYNSKIQDYFNKRAFEDLPAALKPESLSEYLSEDRVKGLEAGSSVYVRNAKFIPTEDDKNFFRTQRALSTQQYDNISVARRNLTVLFGSFKYVEDIAEQAPEFVKYIPTEQKPITNLPAVQLKQQLLDLGWPKGDEGK